MEFFSKLADFFMTPVGEVVRWINELQIALGNAWDTMWLNIGKGLTYFVVESLTVLVISYAVYCAYRVMFTTKDEKFSEYVNKEMIAAIVYMFVRFGGNVVLSYIGGM